ncbi:ATP-binding cassette sub-family C member 4-like isoform X2 [Magallana gigas]|uniref:ATP-binding cassette sub-family C member 4-like isoform X2 n=1 Tax=Magallana gigas TaxID=29159 RepID=UPI003340C8E9
MADKLKGPCPYSTANWLSRFTFWWVFPLFRYGFRHPLTQDHLYDVLPEDQSDLLGDRMENSWNAYVKKCEEKGKKPSLYWAVIAEFKWEWGVNGIFLVASEGIRIAQPYLIGRIISYFQPGSTLSQTEVYIYATVVAVSHILQLIVYPKYFFTCLHIALKMKVAVASLIYRKILKIKITSLSNHSTTSGKIINHLSTDLEKFSYTIESFHFCWLGPLEIVAILYLLYQQIGLVSFLTLAVTVVLLPLQFMLGWIYGKLRMKIGAAGDKRIHLMNQIIAGMRVIKMYCWEKPFSEIVFNLRGWEVSEIWKANIAKSINIGLFQSASVIISMALFGTAWYTGVPLSAQRIYSILGWVFSLRQTIFLFMMYLVENNKQLESSLKRIQSFLTLEDMKVFSESEGTTKPMEKGGVSVCIRDMTTSWHGPHSLDKGGFANKLFDQEMAEAFSLKNIDLDIKKGELLAVVGPVGSGKTSLLLSLLKELPPETGQVCVQGRLGYMAQTPWVMSGTIQANVTFGENVEEGRYRQVLHACALYKDLELMRYGDQTLVGERGLLLSGGQKARLTLARTVYRDADVYLLDDPLGAVDTEVGSHLFQRCICELLRGKTRILVTHQLQYLKSADRIVVLNEGRVVSVGTYDDLVKQGTEFSSILIRHDKNIEEKDERQEKSVNVTGEKSTEAFDDGEFVETGDVGWNVYKDYYLSGRPWLYLPLTMFLLLIAYASYGYGHWYLAKWAELSDSLNLRTQNGSYPLYPVIDTLNQTHGLYTIYMYNITPLLQTSNSTPEGSLITLQGDELMQQYLVAMSVFVVGISLFSLVYFRMSVIISKRLHNNMFRVVMGAKTHFFDSNPVGQILNRFARDLGLIDSLIPSLTCMVIEISVHLAMKIGITCIINPFLLLPLTPLVIVLYLIRWFSLPTTRNMKRLEAMTQSPIFSHISDTLVGLQSIRALGMSRKFLQDFDRFQDRHTSAFFLYLSTIRWFSVNSLFILDVYFVLVILLSLVLRDMIGLSGGLFGMALNYLLTMATPFAYMMRKTADLNTLLTSVERIVFYTKLEQEAPKVSDSLPPSSWPQNGEIKLVNVGLQYSSDTDQVLHNITCLINSREKIGIVGRTGAGKSSLLAALLRLAEPTGEIYIDGVNVLKIGLHELRNKISVIPQDPILFSGTLRKNLDPFEEYTDDQLWIALEQVQLKVKVQSEREGLYMEVSDSGQNLSVGQRQLVCLARAILRQNNILVLDEATANVDHNTDRLIQETIRSRFKNCTVLTVAHRIHTIMDSSRVMVLNQGKLVEFDTPYQLLQIEDGFFRNLVQQTGKAQAKVLQTLAENYHKERS